MMEKVSLSILLLEDSDGDAILISKHIERLSRIEAKITRARSLKDALVQADLHNFDLLIVDLNLPDSEGLTTLERIRGEYFDLPIIVLSGLDDEKIAIESLRLGAQDYLVKGNFTPELLQKTILFALERNKWQMTLKSLAMVDELTNLYNRRGFITLAEQQIKVLKRKKKGYFLMYFDLDYFKSINDELGHAVGDVALKSFADILRKTFRDSDILARFGGDEFVSFIHETHLEDREILEKRLQENTDEFNENSHHPFQIRTSRGVVYCDFNESQPLSLFDSLKKADEKMYQMKKNHVHKL